MYRTLLAGLAALTLLSAPAAHAQVIITVNDATISQGGTGYVDVMVRAASAGSANLGIFGFQFQIDPLPTTRLAFSNPQSDSQLANPNYVLGTDSLDANLAFPVGAVTTTVVPDDTFIGGDQTLSGGDIALTTTDKLLVRLDLTTLTALPASVGDAFTISLILNQPTTGPPYTTFFQDSSTNDIAIDPGSRLTATVYVTAVPEPGPLALGGVCLAAAGAAAWRRRRAA